MSDARVVAIIQARMGSSRLPGKVLRLLGEEPILAWVVERVRRARLVNEVVVATTDDPADNPLVDFCTQRGYPLFRGSQFDVLDRFVQAARTYRADIVVRITADCPLIDPDVVDLTIQRLQDTGADFAANRLPPPWHRTYPIGLDVEVVTMPALESAWKEATATFEREHVLPYLYDETGRFKVEVVDTSPDYGHLRWTVDTPADLEMLQQLVAYLPSMTGFKWQDVLTIWQSHPELAAINANIHHKKVDDVDDRAGKERRNEMTRLTLFSTPKPFTNPHIALIQRNAIQSWLALGDGVSVVLVGDEVGVADVAREVGGRHIPQVQRNTEGTPLLSDIFASAASINDRPLLAFVNADVILMPDFLGTAERALVQYPQFLLVGQRWDLDVREPLVFSPGWQDRLLGDVRQRGRLHPPAGSDYFIYPRGCFDRIPDFAIGRAGWDNWMLYAARRAGWPLVDCTQAVTIVHQDHDYAHLPGGQPHYKLPETFVNIRLAGGRLVTRITLKDANYRMHKGSVKRKPLNWGGFWREVEIAPLLHGHQRLARLFDAMAHPRRAYRDWRNPTKEA